MARALALLLAMAASPGGGAAQSTLDRPPDLSAGWVGDPGRLYLTVMHRFDAGPAPARKVTNTPTMLVAVPVAAGVLTGVNYATNSNVARGRPNEWEVFGRWAPVAGPVDLAVQAGYNLGAGSVDGELTAGVDVGPVRAFGVGRAFSGWQDTDRVRFAAGVGSLVRLTENLALAADVVAPVDLAASESPAWSAGVQARIPYTPHTLSLHASNAATTTLHGSTVGSGTVRYGFEFTIPITLRRYLPTAGSAGDAEPGVEDSDMAGGEMAGREMSPGAMRDDAMVGESAVATMADTVELLIQNLEFATERLEIGPGTTVVWINDDPVAHTATADDESWDSGIIAPGERWARTFTAAGEHAYHCTPHPFMKAVIVVADGGGMDDGAME